MTLYKQLLICILVVFFTLICSVFVMQFNITRDLLSEQQSTKIDETISIVDQPLTSYLQVNDTVSTKSFLNTQLESGVYSKIQLTIINTTDEIVLNNPKQLSEVPNWFQKLITIEPIIRTYVLAKGSTPLASLTVTSNSVDTYQTLWQTSLTLLIAFISALLVGLLLLAAIFTKLLKPLKMIQHNARQMSDNQFSDLLSTPKTEELSDIVIAFKHMSTQLKVHFDQQAQEADNLRNRAYQDPVSGLANRSYLMTKIDSWLTSPCKGGIALLKVDLISDAYSLDGYEAGDRLVQTLSVHMKELINDDSTLARINQSEFMLLAPQIDAQELKTIGRSLLLMTSELQSDPLDIAPVQATVGLVMRNPTDTVSTLLAQADNALMQAKQQLQEPLVLFDLKEQTEESTKNTMGKQQWKALVEEAIANKLFKFNFQKAMDYQQNTLHQEAFAYIQKGNQSYYAGQFLGAIEGLNTSTHLDMFIIDELFNVLKSDKSLATIAVNITKNSVNEPGFIRWLTNKMKSNPELKERIIFELPEICFIKHNESVGLLCDKIHQNNFTFGIDNFGHNFSSIGYLNRFRPAYVKLDFAYTHQIEHQDKADVLASITRTANNLLITPIATRIETISQQEKLTELMVKGFQGYVVDKINSEQKI